LKIKDNVIASTPVIAKYAVNKKDVAYYFFNILSNWPQILVYDIIP